jgi:ABC-type multidrug transport system fused ATPase/permease subunit
MKKEDLKKEYLEASGRYKEQEKQEDRILFNLSVLRFICFAGGLILVIYLFIRSTTAGFLSAILISALFLWLVRLFAEHTGKKEFFASLSLINNNEAEALNGNLSNFDSGAKYIDHTHDFSFDVDLFGEASLFQYLNRTVTGQGRDFLAQWLSDPHVLSEKFTQRKEIIAELSGKKEWRHRFLASGMKVPLEKDRIEGVLRWMSWDSSKKSPAKRLLLTVLPSAAILSLILLIAGILPYQVFVIIILGNLGYVSAGLKDTNRIHRDLTGRFLYIASINSLLKVFENESFVSPFLADMRQQITGEEFSAAASVRRLSRLIESFDSRLNIFAGFFLNGLLLWDYQCVSRLEKWKEENRENFPGWLEILGMMDAYSSLGNYTYNNADFVFPVLSDNGIIFSAKKLGHPLIEADERVCNDFIFDRKGSICIISGANMAGKSTFLRTVAVNFILGMCGCPVCAGEMVFTPVKLFTSMRTTDSLSGHESYFYAELRRLKSLKSKIMTGEPVFFILDEILKGTNSTDKSTGSRMFLKRMVSLEATGLIATHDISLCEMEKEHPQHVFNMCFEIEIDGEAIVFDYILRQGITKKMNAALLMRQMGILD